MNLLFMRARTLCLVVLLLLSGCASVPKAAPVDNIPLAPGDCIVIVFDGDGMDRKPNFYVLNWAGDISLPYISKIHLADLTVEQANERVKESYIPYYFSAKSFSISLMRCQLSH
jgi:protein involved in polysaccharide export with SLBB domain